MTNITLIASPKIACRIARECGKLADFFSREYEEEEGVDLSLHS